MVRFLLQPNRRRDLGSRPERFFPSALLGIMIWTFLRWFGCSPSAARACFAPRASAPSPLPPSQVLKAERLVVPWTAVMVESGEELVYVSHEWRGAEHPDPLGVLTSMLCHTLEVRACPSLQCPSPRPPIKLVSPSCGRAPPSSAPPSRAPPPPPH